MGEINPNTSYMSTPMERIRTYLKVCQFCGKEYYAYKSTTKCCSDSCSKRLYKQNKRTQLLQIEERTVKKRLAQDLQQEAFLSISDAARLLHVSRPTMMNIIKTKCICVHSSSKRMKRINKEDLLQACSKEISAPIVKETNLISVKEALEKYKISITWFYHKIRPANLTPIKIKGVAFYDAEDLKKLLYVKQHVEIRDWYTVSQIVEQFNLKRPRVYEILTDNKEIPRKRVGKDILISKKHWDDIRGVSMQENEKYYSVPDATQLYNIKRSYLYDIIREHNIPKIKRGQYIYIEKSVLDSIMSNRKK
ncbi:MAG: helix-turn-helix domain-containing protein [Bacteroidales bacterium]|nr:helix-turn-helix domain-containing protein [Bacteroidales bacterium]